MSTFRKVTSLVLPLNAHFSSYRNVLSESWIKKAAWVAGPMLLLTGVGSAAVNSIEGNVSPEYAAPVLMAANPADAPFKRRFYAGVGAGMSQLMPDLSQAPSVMLIEDGGPGGTLNLGLDINRHFSIELHASSLGNVLLEPGGELAYVHAGASALLYLGLSKNKKARQGFLGFLRAGYGVLGADENSTDGMPVELENSTASLMGLGLEYAVNRKLSMRAELISFQKDVNYAQLGLVYRFGKPAMAKVPVSPIATDDAIEDRLDTNALETPVETDLALEDRLDTNAFETPVETELALEVPEPEVRIFGEPETEQVIAQEMEQCLDLAGEIERVNFEFDSANISRDAEQKLEDVANEFIKCGTETIAVNGHTDSIGTMAYNQVLSERRADSVIYFFESIGMRVDRFAPKSFGERRPVESNETAAGRAANRRVELRVR